MSMTPTPHQPDLDSSNRFTKKPVTIEARQFDGTRECAERLIVWMGAGRYNEAERVNSTMHPPYLDILTLEDGPDGRARHVASVNDWIIKGVQSEFYACKPDIFAATYSPEAKRADSDLDIEALRKAAEAASPGPWVAKNGYGAGLEIYMSHPQYPDKDWPAFGTDSAGCKKGLVTYETWVQFPNEVRDAAQARNAQFIAAANPATILTMLDRLERAEAPKSDELTCDDIERLRLALSWVGYATPEGLEECGIRHVSLTRDLINGVLSHKASTTEARRAEAAAGAVPEGWKLVPLEPTEEMVQAWLDNYEGYIQGVYRAMLAATPPVGCVNNTQPFADTEGVKEVIEAARNLVKAKGRYHTELNYKELAAALSRLNGEKK